MMIDYFGIINDTVKLLEVRYNDLLYKKSSQAEVDIDSFTMVTDYDEEIKNTLDLLNYLQILKNAPKFYRMNENTWLEYLESQVSGSDFFIRLEISYKVKEYEDVQTVAENFDVDWRDILMYNNLKSDEIAAGTEIIIPVKKKYSISAVNPDVFGTQNEKSAWGKDLENKLSENYLGDLFVLDEEKTLKQSIQNYTMPILEEILIEEHADDILPDIIRTRLAVKYLGDNRIEDVLEINVDEEDEAYSISSIIRAINSESEVEV